MHAQGLLLQAPILNPTDFNKAICALNVSKIRSNSFKYLHACILWQQKEFSHQNIMSDSENWLQLNEFCHVLTNVCVHMYCCTSYKFKLQVNESELKSDMRNLLLSASDVPWLILLKS